MSTKPNEKENVSPQQNMKEGKAMGERLAYSKLLNFEENFELHHYLQSMKRALSSDVIARPSNKLVPRFGALSLLAAGTGFFVYDHPELIKKVPTAFACGDYVFFSAPCLRRLKQQGADTVAFVGIHELCHINLLHALRMLDVHPKLRNIAMDYIINTRIRISFEDSAEAGEWRKKHAKTGEAPAPVAILRYGDMVREFLGFKSGDLDKFGRLSEEEAARLLREDVLEQLRQQMQDKQKRQGQGEPQPGDGDGDGDSIMDIDDIREMDPELADQLEKDAQQNGQGKPGQGDPTQSFKSADGIGQNDEVMTEDRLRDVLEKAGLGNIADKLDLAKSPEQSNQKSEERAIKAKAKAQESSRMYREAGVKLPGGHIDNFIEEMIGDLNRAKMTFRVGFRHMMAGEGNRTDYQDEVAAPIYYVDPADMNMSDPIFLGSEIPSRRSGDILCFIDTSLSMGSDEIREALSELYAIAKSERDDVRIILKWSDTAVRKTEIIREQDLDKPREFGAAGRGGTDLANCVRQGMNDPVVKQSLQRGRLAGIVYFSDLGDSAPQRSELPAKMPPFAYVATSNSVGVNDFRREVSDYAQVLEIEQGAVVDLTKKKPNATMTP